MQVIARRMIMVRRTERSVLLSRMGVIPRIARNYSMFITTFRKPTEVASPTDGYETSTTSSHITPKIDKLQKPFKIIDK
jgi:hypothetical protein